MPRMRSQKHRIKKSGEMCRNLVALRDAARTQCRQELYQLFFSSLRVILSVCVVLIAFGNWVKHICLLVLSGSNAQSMGFGRPAANWSGAVAVSVRGWSNRLCCLRGRFLAKRLAPSIGGWCFFVIFKYEYNKIVVLSRWWFRFHFLRLHTKNNYIPVQV